MNSEPRRDAQQGTPVEPSLPRAGVEPSTKDQLRQWVGEKGIFRSRMWFLTAACAVLALVLWIPAQRSRGLAITIAFETGHGLQPGDTVRLRGIDVGIVEQVVLSSDLSQVVVTARLTPESAAVAREGTKFWIERPQVSPSGVRGLETVIGPKFIGVQPGPPDAKAARHFIGVESPRRSSDSLTHQVVVKFRQGHGLQVGAPVRFRGVQVGEVVAIELSESFGQVLVHAELVEEATRLTRAGTLYWVERAQVGIGQLRSLETVVTGTYLAVSPGPLAGEIVEQFEGLETPPAEADSLGGMEVVLESQLRHGLQAGSPVTYRGVEIGRVVHVGLASDGASVETRLYVEPRYRQVIREDSRFWPTSGVGVEIGLLGMRLDADSLTAIAAGGVSVATPPSPGPAVASGHRFTLQPEVHPDWLAWRPQLQIGIPFSPEMQPIPTPLRGAFRWKSRSWGITRSRQSLTWVHVVAGDRIVCPLDAELAESLPDQIQLEIEGEVFNVMRDDIQRWGPLALIRGIKLPNGDLIGWQVERLRSTRKPEDCVLISGTGALPIAEARLQGDGPWPIDTAIALNEDWRGAGAVARADGALIGLLVWRDGEAVIAPVQNVH